MRIWQYIVLTTLKLNGVQINSRFLLVLHCQNNKLKQEWSGSYKVAHSHRSQSQFLFLHIMTTSGSVDALPTAPALRLSRGRKYIVIEWRLVVFLLLLVLIIPRARIHPCSKPVHRSVALSELQFWDITALPTIVADGQLCSSF